MLVYEFMSNGTLRDHLSGTPYIHSFSLPFIDLTIIFSRCSSLRVNASKLAIYNLQQYTPHPPPLSFLSFCFGAKCNHFNFQILHPILMSLLGVMCAIIQLSVKNLWVLQWDWELPWDRPRASSICIVKLILLYFTKISRLATYYWTLSIWQKLLILDFHDLHQFQILKGQCLVMYPLLWRGRQ